MKKIALFTLLLSFGLGFSSSLQAQLGFTPVKEGEYDQITRNDVQPSYLTLGGKFETSSYLDKNGAAGSRKGPGVTRQELVLGFKSTYNEHISLYGEISNQRTELELQRSGYMSERAEEDGNSRDAQGMNLFFKQAYLEYNHNPMAVLQLGYQKANPADRRGLVYEGIGSGITQTCRMGTWCYYIGSMKLGPKEDNAIYWGQIDYPVYETGVIIQDSWAKTGKRQASSLNVELFRLFYNGSKVPMNSAGSWAGDGGNYHVKDGAGRQVYFDNKKVEYIGTNIQWNYHSLQTKMHFVLLGGQRRFYAGDSATETYEEISTKRGQGALMRLIELDWHFNKNWKVRLAQMHSPGTEQKTATQNYWDQDSTAYQEIQKGYFGEGLVYFNGIQQSGDGHSVSNLNYNQFNAYYMADRQDYSFEFRAFELKRDQEVFNQAGAKKSSIGKEYDLLFSWKLEEALKFTGYAGIFQPGGAYSPNDFTAPDVDQEDFSRWGAHVIYSF